MEEFEVKRALLGEFRDQRDRDAMHIDAVDRYGVRLWANGEDITDGFQLRRRELLGELDGIIAQLESELKP